MAGSTSRREAGRWWRLIPSRLFPFLPPVSTHFHSSFFVKSTSSPFTLVAIALDVSSPPPSPFFPSPLPPLLPSRPIRTRFSRPSPSLPT